MAGPAYLPESIWLSWPIQMCPPLWLSLQLHMSGPEKTNKGCPPSLPGSPDCIDDGAHAQSLHIIIVLKNSIAQTTWLAKERATKAIRRSYVALELADQLVNVLLGSLSSLRLADFLGVSSCDRLVECLMVDLGVLSLANLRI